jgi:hypothetical protein
LNVLGRCKQDFRFTAGRLDGKTPYLGWAIFMVISKDPATDGFDFLLAQGAPE